MRNILYIFIAFLTAVSFQAQEKEMSLSMQEAIDFAIKNNFDNKVALNDIRAAIKRKWETTATGLPQLNAAVNYRNNIKQPVSLIPAEITGGTPGTFTPVVFGTKQTANATATLSQLLFDGSYLVGLQAAKTYLKISEQAKEKTELATREAVVNAYGNILVAEESIKILERNKKVNDRLLKGARVGYENGLVELEDIERFEISEGNLLNSLRNAVRMKEIAYQFLNVALGNSINTKLILEDNLESLVVANTNLQLLAQDFNLNNHIDFRIAENSRESNRLLYKLERSKALPSLSAFINYGFAANSDSFTFFNGNQQWFQSSVFGVGLNIPIFSSLGRSAKTQQAKIALESSDIRLEEVKQRLNLQVEQVRSNYQLSIENYETAKKNLDLAERIEKKQKIKFDEGISTSYQLLEARNQLYTQQNYFLQSMLNIIANKAKLENALNIPLK